MTSGIILLWALPLLPLRMLRSLWRYGWWVWVELRYGASPDLTFFMVENAKFLPISATQTEEILEDVFRLSPSDRERLRIFCRLCQMVIHQSYHERLLSIVRCYAPFDPDSDLIAEKTELPTEERRRLADQFCAEVERILEGGNYVLLTPDQIEACLEAKTRLGLVVRVDPETSRRAKVWYRGVRAETYRPKVLFSRWRNIREVTVRHLLRVAVLIRTTERPTSESRKFLWMEGKTGTGTTDVEMSPREVLRLKLFKDLPVEDLKIISPDPKLK
ncbi:MAG: hypothetical protein Q4C47_05735, partial [Planctomycetia bacterium]|nr:hypothetical protein [Planctomycetia bacterium]